MHGVSVAQDYEKAIHYYELAVAQGNADAQYILGYMCMNGEGVMQDYKKAREYYELAAAQGHTSTQEQLGYCTIMERVYSKILMKQGTVMSWQQLMVMSGCRATLGTCT